MNKIALQELIEALKKFPPEKFNMDVLYHDNSTDERCLFGVGMMGRAIDLVYSVGVKGAWISNKYSIDEGHTGLFLGASRWAAIDNTIEGAIERIQWVIDGKDPHQYKEDALSEIMDYHDIDV